RFPIGVATTQSVPPAPSVTRSRASTARGPGPAAGIEVIDARGPWPKLGDRRDLALELGTGDHPVHPLDHLAREAQRDDLVDRAAFVDPPEQQSIEGGVIERTLGLIGLARPQVGGWGLADDLVRDTDRRGELPDLALVQVTDRVEGARVVAEHGRVPDERFGLVAGPDDKAT